MALTKIKGAGVNISATEKLYFDDGGNTYIYESAADVLDVYVGGANMVKLTESTTDTVTVTGDLTVGVDGTGHDVKFFGDTGSAYMLWDQSADDLVLAGAAGIDLAGDIDVDGTANLDIVDIDGAVDMASTLTLAGNADFNGDLDVDGTTNLDAVDIDGNVQLDGTFTVGTDGSGQDVIFYSGTSGDNFTWDSSEECLTITGTDGAQALKIADGDLVVVDKIYIYDNDGGEYISGDGTDLTITSGNDIVLSPTGSVGIGLNPSGWDTYGKVLQIGEQFNIMANDDGQDTYITANRYYASGWKWQNTDTGASQIFMSAGAIKFSNVGTSGHSAGDAQTIVDRMTINSSGDVDIEAGDIFFSTAGKGIVLGVTSNTDANTLDDYEEGTFTPVYTGNGGSIGSTAYDSRDGDYTKIGNIVYLSGYVDLSNNGDWSGTVLITGIPFNAANNGNQNLGACMLENITIATTNYFSRVGPNEQYVTFVRNVNDSTSVYLQPTEVPDTGILRFNVVYTAA